MSTTTTAAASPEEQSPKTVPFPLEDLIPKKETNVYSFLKQNPEYNGKDVVIGILDTGVDPGAYGLQTLPDGKTPKLIDTIDCTGSGDVDVSDETQAKLTTKDDTKYWEVTGISGRTLKLNPSWKIMPFPVTKKESKESDELKDSKKKEEGDDSKQEEKKESSDADTVTVRLGIKRAYELFPSKLVSRVKEHRLKALKANLQNLVADLKIQLAEWHSKHDKPTKEQLRVKEDLEARLELLQDKEWENDPGPLYDCVVFYDGTNFRAALDVQEDGDLTNAAAMTDYHKEYQWSTFGTLDQFNYAVNFYSNGKVLSIVCDAGAHGSHVAGIACANENSEERNGVAPGAQIVALKIGDSRLSSMETGTALTRAFIEAVKHKCDVINLSYGEGCAVPNRGRIVELAEELVWKHNVIFVSSAGNNGPAISTVGAPGGTSSAILGVAAYVSPAMMKADYSLMTTSSASSKNKEEQEQRLVGTTYTWSSVGPTVDGDFGVNITAPGGAITSVPNWTMQKNQLMNGTSMSSPHTAGCVALLVSACKANNIPVHATGVLRAIQNTAKPLAGLSVLQQGWGMLQVDKAWEYLLAQKDCPYMDVHFDVCIDNRSGNPRGIYLRQPSQVVERQTFSINVNPSFGSDDNVDKETQRRRIEFEMHFQLAATKPWVSVPKHFSLLHNGRSFKIDVDPTNLSPGVHTASVLAVDSQDIGCGVMFSVPITVVKPLEEEAFIDLGELEFHPAQVRRFFLSVPLGATWMDVTVRDCRNDANKDASSRLVVLHTVQILPHAAYRNAEVQKYFNLLPEQTTVTSVPVHSGITCEVDLARYWSASGSTKVNVSIQFRGVWPVPWELQIITGGGGKLVRMECHTKDEIINPSAELTHWKSPVTPKMPGVITPLGEDRDVLPSREKRIYQLVLSYEFKQEEAGSITPRAPALQGVLYESAYDSQIMLVFDGDKKYLGVADSWPSDVKVPKGSITIRLQIRHDNVEMLEKLKDLSIWIERKLEKEISLSAYATKETMMVGKETMKKRTLRNGTNASVFFAEPPQSKLPSGCKPGDVLFGKVTYAAGDAALPGDGKRPGGFPISFMVGPKCEKPKDITPEVPDERGVQEKLADAVRDLKVGQLDKLTAKEKEDGRFEELYALLEKEYPDHIPLLVASLKQVDTSKTRDDNLQKVVETADKVLQQISEDELALHFGKNHDKDDPKSCKEHKEMEEKKGYYVEALARKARAISEMDGRGPDEFLSALNQLKSWEDIDSNNKYAVLVLEREKRAGRFGSMLKLLNALLKSDGDTTKGGICPMSKSDLLKKRFEVLEELNYSMLVEHDKKWRCISTPKDFALF